MELDFTVMRDAGLHLHRYPCTGITTNAAIWGEKGKERVWRLENVEGRVQRTTEMTNPEMLRGINGREEDENPDYWLSTRALPAGWYEVEREPLVGLTRPDRFYFEIVKFNGPSFLSRVTSSRKRLELVMLRGWM